MSEATGSGPTIGEGFSQSGVGHAAFVGTAYHSIVHIHGTPNGAPAESFVQPIQAFVDRFEHDRIFTSRKSLLDQLSGFMTVEPSGVFVIEGSPGTGKSGFMAELASRKQAITHVSVLGDATAGTLNILGQLARRQPEHEVLVPATPTAGALVALLRRTLDRVASEQQPLIIGIDAPLLPHVCVSAIA